jgi:beta-N-acetylhexosaminidase
MYATREEIRRAAGHLICCGFAGRDVGAELKEILREVRPAGLLLFGRNVESPEQVAELGRELKALRPNDPLLLAVDQEGGRVARIRAPATQWPAMGELGRIGDADLAERVGWAMGTELRALSLDVNLAPVLDVATRPENEVIGDRAFSDQPEVVAELGLALARGLERAGVAACAKHFPGHGDTTADSHVTLPVVEHELERLRQVEWLPFRRAAERRLGAIMVGHIVVAALDPDAPASLSAPVIGALRGELGFAGVVVSDDLAMRPVAARFRPDEIARRAVLAGVDLLLCDGPPERILAHYRGLVVGAEQTTLPHAALLAAERRVLAWRDRFVAPGRPWPETAASVGALPHQLLAAEIRERARQLD